MTPTLLAANDPPGLYQWTVTLTNGSQTVTDRFNVNYTAATQGTPVVYGVVQPTGTSIGGVNPPILSTATGRLTGLQPSAPPNTKLNYGAVKGVIIVSVDGVDHQLTSHSNYPDGINQDLTYQCVALIKNYIELFTGQASPALGNGNAVAGNLPAATNGEFEYYPNGSLTYPVVGSVISIDLGDANGHVGIAQYIENIDSNTIKVTLFDQNFPTESGRWKIVTFSKGVDGTWVGTMPNNNNVANVVGWATPP